MAIASPSSAVAQARTAAMKSGERWARDDSMSTRFTVPPEHKSSFA
jgi:hypothetical protein